MITLIETSTKSSTPCLSTTSAVTQKSLIMNLLRLKRVWLSGKELVP